MRACRFSSARPGFVPAKGSASASMNARWLPAIARTSNWMPRFVARACLGDLHDLRAFLDAARLVGQLDVDQDQLFFELCSSDEQPAVRRIRERVAVEDQFVLATDRLHVEEENLVIARALAEQDLP